ncbi:MAG TPA: hypothetical protein VMF89_19445 [Polyangiales bacterium]|nr:hypothetical protein [Polyangiales bacterium]
MDFENYEEELIDAFKSIAYQLKCLGNGDAASHMGAIEYLSVQIKEGSERIASSLSEIAEAIRDRP